MSNTPKESDEESLFAELNDDELIQIEGNEVRVNTPIAIHTSNGDITIEIHIPTRGSKERHLEEHVGGTLCEHEHKILVDSLSAMVKKILDHRFGSKIEGKSGRVWTSPVMKGETAKADIQALIKKGVSMMAGKDKYDA